MVEYSFEEALTLLTKNLENAEINLRELNEDLDFLKDQITTTEVSILYEIYFPCSFSFTFQILQEFTILMLSKDDWLKKHKILQLKKLNLYSFPNEMKA